MIIMVVIDGNNVNIDSVLLFNVNGIIEIIHTRKDTIDFNTKNKLFNY